jgi:hypothetical protein
MESLLGRKNKNGNKLRNEKTIFTNKGATEDSNKTLLQEMPINWAAKNFFTFQISQLVCVI